MEVGLWVPYTTLALAAVGATAAVIGVCRPYAKARGEAAAKVSACLPSPKVVLNFNEIGSRRRHAKLGFAPARDGSVCQLTDAQVIFPKGKQITLKDNLATERAATDIVKFHTAMTLGPDSHHETVSVTVMLDRDLADPILIRFNGHRCDVTPSQFHVDIELPTPLHSVV